MGPCGSCGSCWEVSTEWIEVVWPLFYNEGTNNMWQSYRSSMCPRLLGKAWARLASWFSPGIKEIFRKGEVGRFWVQCWLVNVLEWGRHHPHPHHHTLWTLRWAQFWQAMQWLWMPLLATGTLTRDKEGISSNFLGHTFFKRPGPSKSSPKALLNSKKASKIIVNKMFNVYYG